MKLIILLCVLLTIFIFGCSSDINDFSKVNIKSDNNTFKKENLSQDSLNVNNVDNLIIENIIINNTNVNNTNVNNMNINQTNNYNLRKENNFSNNNSSILYDDVLLNTSVYDDIILHFFDLNTNCNIDAKIFVDNVTLGYSVYGNFTLSYHNYTTLFTNESELDIIGNTSSCFNNSVNFPFIVRYIIYNLTSYFNSSEAVIFDINLNPRGPSEYSLMQFFVRPDDVHNYVKNFTFKSKDTSRQLKELVDINFEYVSDNRQFKWLEYWQLPNEILVTKKGDCEDWAFLALSIIREYNSSLSCYNAMFQTHVSVFCYLKREIIIFESDGSMHNVKYDIDLTSYDNRMNVWGLLGDYFDYWGLSPRVNKMDVLLNDKEIITFNSNEEFVEWSYNKMK